MKFMASVVAEMKRVTWPTFNQNVRNTAIVLVTSGFFAILLGTVDWIFEQGLMFLSK
ncbi:Preprotein translocase subunit SecE [Weissella ceti]|uniref:Preprotein translocase subunit SecE n=3 Tax=Lactobacillaceae TaxID=33958 RepID=A0A075U7C8_9LACO|nr:MULTISPECIES: preprotein translocase subunit SecE [Weissella]AIG65997.1 Preprotein translocase subunit SecE [Weissella tructae]AIM63377.1 Preprotein translocase subunit SecE [Weissella ceti]AIM64711.1 Preprotein translocase subunit SecE [Weissella ceti]ELA07368.1 preprotein translocase subunit SecE [Weissella ceti NC36]QVV91152.1 preprotein translocase subunit SecE [Weissella tructae]